MSPSFDHERCNRLIESLVVELGLAWAIDIESAGSTTFKKKPRGAGPDSCFYVGTAFSLAGKTTIDLPADPPPNIAVEIDLSRTRIDKRSIYASIGVAEFWRYAGDELSAVRLGPDGCEPIAASGLLKGLPVAELGRFLKLRKTTKASDILRA